MITNNVSINIRAVNNNDEKQTKIVEEAARKYPPKFIRLLDPTGTTVLDSISTEYEDSFCIETFGDLIRSTEGSEPKDTKHFIIARVQTWDPKQPDRTFYSYYHAHHLNKLLFQTQMYLDIKLIHRLRVLNPLTNTDIIGNILYFIVVGRSVVRNAREPSPLLQQHNADTDTVTLSSHNSPNIPVSAATLKSPLLESMTSPQLSDPVSLNLQMHCGQPDEVVSDGQRHHGNISTAANVPKSPLDGSAIGWTLGQSITKPITAISDATPFTATLINSNSTSTATPPSKLFNRKPSSIASDSQLQDELVTEKTAMLSTTQQRTPLAKTSTTANKPLSAKRLVSANGRGQDLTIKTTRFPTTENHFNTGQSPSLESPTTVVRTPINGVLSQHGAPLSPQSALIPPSAKERRRQLSFMNSIVTSGDKNATIDDWKGLLEDNDLWDDANGDYDSVRPFSDKQQQKRLVGGSGSPTKTMAEYQVYYDAILFATDSDFLEKSVIRHKFKENAVHQDDATLFEMRPYTGLPDPEQETGRPDGELRPPSLFVLFYRLFEDWRVWDCWTWTQVISVLVFFLLCKS